MRTPCTFVGVITCLVVLSAPSAESAPLEVPQAAWTFQPPRFRPHIGFAWMSVETHAGPPAATIIKSRASWFGLQASGDAALVRMKHLEVGAYASLFSSVFGISEESQNTTSAEIQVQPFVIVKPDVPSLGQMQLRASAGFFGSWRFGAQPDSFLAPIRAVQVRGDISSSFDGRSRVGIQGSYAFSETSVTQAGGYFSQRIIGPLPDIQGDHPDRGSTAWDLRLAFQASVAKSASVQENWTTFQFGISGAI